MTLEPPGGGGGEVRPFEMEQGEKIKLTERERRRKTKTKVRRSRRGQVARPQPDIRSEGPSTVNARRHSKLPLSDKEMLSVLAEGKRSLWSVGLW